MKYKDKKTKIIRINSDEKDFYIFKAINKIHRHIKNAN